ncbi:hypothetical protein AJ80_08402 [Polytolypa hystricis UAMH7299]|uniref:Protein kinase domain-containing protein n=1 Tax=Polytolypa hystricis (strain UAMH7299) TaxID=1447883 RepID=A0A2B7X8J9_POLH7|nr:hypothetical protein AJ80_08402 [Polytolypa hystricis UAMH7299]
MDEQSQTWALFCQYLLFMSNKQFPSSHQLDYVLKTVCPITAEIDLQYYERDTVENQVDSIYGNDILSQEFQLAGSVTFESHMNLGASMQGQSDEEMQQLSVGPNISASGEQTPKKRKRKAPGEDILLLRGQADRFCVYRRGNDEHIPAIAIEYKAPHKLTLEEIATGLTQEIQPARDVINKEEDSSEFYSKRLVTVVITQLFSYMVGKGVRYGYVCTGEVFLFLHIPEDPSIVRYAMCVPNQDVRTGHEGDFYLTAVAQVVAFTLRALASSPPSQAWHDAAAELGVWPVESPSPPPPNSPSPANNQSIGRRREPDVQSTRQKGQDNKSRGQERRGGSRESKRSTTIRINDRPYCSQKCLLGLRDGGRLDPLCPNFHDHREKNISSHDFLTLVRNQLATDRRDNADCCPLYKAGSYGALFKVRLSSHGFILVAKGARFKNQRALLHERTIYDKLHVIQGIHVPVCLGIVELEPKRPYYYNEGKYTHMLLLSWAGKPITGGLSPSISDMIVFSLRAIHQQGVLHRDAEPQNILWNDTCRCPMIVDFGQALIRNPLSSVSTNTARKKRLRGAKSEDAFVDELQTVQYSLEDLVRNSGNSKIRKHL